MNRLLALLILASAPALAQAPATPSVVKPKAAASCPDCGVVRSIRSVQKEARPLPADSQKPSGFVATIPLGSSGAKPQIGSSAELGRDSVPETTTWEVVVRLDDGRFRVLLLEDPGNLRVGDKVLVEGTKITLR
jgi:hypothetical protein